MVIGKENILNSETCRCAVGSWEVQWAQLCDSCEQPGHFLSTEKTKGIALPSSEKNAWAGGGWCSWGSRLVSHVGNSGQEGHTEVKGQVFSH